MKLKNLISKPQSYSKKVIALLFLLFCYCTSFAQTRIYADQQINGNSGLCAGCIVNNAANAINTNHSDFATLNITLGLVVPPSTYQTLVFSSTQKPAARTPVMVKLGTGDQLLSVGILGAVSLQAFDGALPVGNPVSASTLISALNNNNQVEVALTPQQNYDRVRVTLNGGLVAGLSNINLYGAYFNTPGTTACTIAADELNGISAGLLGLGADVGGVVNPQQVVDGNLSTASTLNAGVGLAGAYAQQTVVFNKVSVVGDSARLTLSLPQALLDAGVFTNIQVSTANGTVSNNDNHNLSSALLNVRLLEADANGRKAVVSFAPSAVFDRVQLRLGGGIANVLSTLKFYEAEQLMPRPVLGINGTLADQISVCAGSKVTLSAAAKANTVFRWYNLPTGGTAVFEGNTFETPALNATTTYYAEAVSGNCVSATCAAVTVNINQAPANFTVTPSTQTKNTGETATFTAASADANAVFNWYNLATGGVSFIPVQLIPRLRLLQMPRIMLRRFLQRVAPLPAGLPFL